MVSLASWWAPKVRQFRSHVTARVGQDERAGLADWLTPRQLALFDSMHVADRRHGLDVVATLRRDGAIDHDLLVAGLLHDAGKGDTGVWPRVVFALGQVYGASVPHLARLIPGWRAALDRLAVHAEASASLAASAGCSQRTVELIRHQDAPVDPEAGRALQLADEAN
jgi:hypothetical protein